MRLIDAEKAEQKFVQMAESVNAGRGSVNYCPHCGADMRGEQDG